MFIANVVKCRPPQNRDPLPEEIGACSDWLGEQLDIIRPKVIVTLGRYSLARFLPGQPIGASTARARKVGEQWVVPMYHPAAALHQGSSAQYDRGRLPKNPGIPRGARRREHQAALTPPSAAGSTASRVDAE